MLCCAILPPLFNVGIAECGHMAFISEDMHARRFRPAQDRCGGHLAPAYVQ